MKRFFTVFLALSLIFGCATTAFAHGHGRGHHGSGNCGVSSPGTCRDGNGDGHCDHVHGGCSFLDEDCDSVCDNCGKEVCTCCHTGACPDEDGDGICDHSHADCTRTDEDGDGLCDDCAEPFCAAHRNGPCRDCNGDRLCDDCGNSYCSGARREQCGRSGNRGGHRRCR